MLFNEGEMCKLYSSCIFLMSCVRNGNMFISHFFTFNFVSIKHFVLIDFFTPSLCLHSNFFFLFLFFGPVYLKICWKEKT